MPPGRHDAVFRLRAEGMKSRPARSQNVAEVEVTRDDGQLVASWSLTARDLPPGGVEREVVLPFELPDTAFNSELRVRSLGTVPLIANVLAAVREGVGEGLSPSARPLGRDPARVHAQAGLRSVQRVVGWPARRLLDPRLDGLRNHVQLIAATIGDRIDARANELGARIDGLAQSAQPARIESTQSERAAVLPYVLCAVGTLAPGTTIFVAEATSGAISSLLGALGYDVVTPAVPDTARPVAAAAVLRTESVDPTSVEQIVQRVPPGGDVILITEGPDHGGVEQLLDGWDVEDQTRIQTPGEKAPWLTLTRASLPAPVESGLAQ